MNLLFITRERSNELWKNPDYLSQELSKLTNLVCWHESGHIKKILEQIPINPDFILISDVGMPIEPQVYGFDTIDIPSAVIFHDLHRNVNQRKQFIHNNNIQHIFTIYRDKFLGIYPEFKNRMWWFPHHVNINIFKDYGFEKEIDFLMMGNTRPRDYPLRHHMAKKFDGVPGFVKINHPGYRNISKKNAYTGTEYAEQINRSKIFLTCDSIFKLPVTKYYEVLACKTLLLAPESQELQDLGFTSGENFVSITKDDFLEKANYYLTNQKERERIAQNGYEFVRAHHSTEVRAKQLFEHINVIVDSLTWNNLPELREQETQPLDVTDFLTDSSDWTTKEKDVKKVDNSIWNKIMTFIKNL